MRPATVFLGGLATAGLSLWACKPSAPQQMTDCGDAACRQAWCVDHWADDPAGVSADVASLDDPVEQMAIVRAISDSSSASLSELCAALPPGVAKTGCAMVDRRPHLRGPIPEATPRSLPPTETTLPQTQPFIPWLATLNGDNYPNPWSNLAPMAATCDTAPRPSGGTSSALGELDCRKILAQQAAGQGKAEQAAALCIGIQEPKWRSDCFMVASEQTLHRTGSAWMPTSRIPDAVHLCVGAGPYFGRCLTHIQNAINQQTPPANQLDTAGWSRMRRGIDAATAAVRELDPTVATLFEDDTWSRALLLSFQTTDQLCGITLDSVPRREHHQVRAAAAWRMLDLDPSPSRTLDEWTARLNAILANRSALPGSMTRSTTAHVHRVDWSTADLQPFPDARFVPHLGSGYRVSSTDPVIDGVLSIIQAAASRPHPRKKIILDGTHHPSALVEWTARHLLREQP